MRIRIYGASDDLIEVEGCEGADEFNSYQLGADGAPGALMWRGDLRAPSGDIMRAHAVLDGCWSIALGQVDDDLRFPSWPVTIAQHPGTAYSTMAEIDAPEGTVLENVWPGSDEDAA